MRVLIVCTANICRSASAEALLRDAIAARPELLGVEVRSAGTHAIEGLSGCRVAPALAGRADEHRSQPLTPELVGWADLVLAAAREHRAAVVAMDPGARSKVFTLRQAGRIARWLATQGARAALLGPAAFVEDMDAARGLELGAGGRDDGEAGGGVGDGYGNAGGRSQPRRALLRGSLRRSRPSRPHEPEDAHPDDIIDPHVHGAGFHALSAVQVEEAVDALVDCLAELGAT